MNESTTGAISALIDSPEYYLIGEYIVNHSGDTRIEALLEWCFEFRLDLYNDDFIDWEDVASYFPPKKTEDW